MSKSTNTTYDSIFKTAAQKFGVSFNLLKAVAKNESNYDPNAVSPAGAVGIMQLMPDTATYLGVSNSYDPTQNIYGGAKYLSELLKEFSGDTTKAVAAYNAGPDAVVKYGGVPPYDETKTYVTNVLATLADLGGSGDSGGAVAGGGGGGGGSSSGSSVIDKAQQSIDDLKNGNAVTNNGPIAAKTLFGGKIDAAFVKFGLMILIIIVGIVALFHLIGKSDTGKTIIETSKKAIKASAATAV